MTRYNPAQEILNAIGALDTGKRVMAYFKNGKTGTYTEAIMDLLKTDQSVEVIIDAETGEVLYEQEA